MQTATKTTDREERTMQYREASFRVQGDGDKQTIRMSISSEAPVLTYGYLNGEYRQFYEVLDHSPASIDMSRCGDGLVILDTHHGDQIGLMDVEISDRKLGGDVEFCSGARAQEIRQDAIRKLRRNTSVGYRADPDSYRVEGEQDGIPVVRAMSWMPYEASFVPVPADPGVGVGRAEKEVKENKTPANAGKEKTNMEPKEMSALFARGAKFGIEADKVQELIDAGKGRAELNDLIVEKQGEEAKAIRKEADEAKARAEKAEKERAGNFGIAAPAIVGKEHRYSVMNVIRSLCGMKADIGMELELSDELARLRGVAAKGIIVPHVALGQRDFTVSGTSSATVATNLLSGEFIDVLRTRSVLGAAGVRFLTGLTGNIAIPKMSAGATGYWVSEAGDITESAPTLGQVTGSPNTCGVLTDISRRLLLQSTPAADMLVRDEIIERIIRTVQIAVFAGTGTNGQPSAITNATGINNPSVTKGTPTYAELLGFPGSIMADNAEMDGQQWIMTAEVWQKLAATFTDGTAKAEHVLDWASKTCLGFPYHVTEDVPANSLWFGAWNVVNVGVWGNGIDINVDDKTLSSSGGIRIVGLQDVDVMVRQGYALAYNTAVTN